MSDLISNTNNPIKSNDPLPIEKNKIFLVNLVFIFCEHMEEYNFVISKEDMLKMNLSSHLINMEDIIRRISKSIDVRFKNKQLTSLVCGFIKIGHIDSVVSERMIPFSLTTNTSTRKDVETEVFERLSVSVKAVLDRVYMECDFLAKNNSMSSNTLVVRNITQ